MSATLSYFVPLLLTVAAPSPAAVELAGPEMSPVPAPAPSIAADACRPAPFETCGETTLNTSPSRRFGFDDNKYCPAGPGISCVLPTTRENPRPGTGFVNAEGCIFEMYVVADCGTEIHLPLCDVETATVRARDPQGNPVLLHAVNGAVTGRTCVPGQQSSIPFEESGFEISWSATFCDPVGGGNTGGPGNFTLMDLWFTGEDDGIPGDSLCGVYTIEFESFAGCGWELFANCDGSNQDQFLVFDDRCEAEEAVTPLPELVVTDVRLSRGEGGCTVDYCVDVQNVGCEEPLPFPVRVSEQVSGDTVVHEDVGGLAPGESTTVCGTLEVDAPAGSTVTVPVTAEVDPDLGQGDTVVECREVSGASSCNPAVGDDLLTRSVTVECNRPPECDAGEASVWECAGGRTPVELDGRGSSDPDGDALTWSWTTDCPGELFDADGPTPRLDFDSRDLGCSQSCAAFLTVSDGIAETSCSTRVEVRDTTPPELVQVPADLDVECSTKGGTPADDPDLVAWRNRFRGEDICGGLGEEDDMPDFFPAGCASGLETPVTVTYTDGCGLESAATRSVTVKDTTPPVWVEAPEDLTLECSAPGGTPADVPEVRAWRARFRAEDVCHGHEDRDDLPGFFPAGCAPGAETPVTVTASDACALETPITRSVFVQDTVPPVIEEIPFDGACLWPPNHKYVCLDDGARDVAASDVCDPDPEVRFAGCSSDQPEDARDPAFPGDNGDGKTFEDCRVADGGADLCLRSERLGTDPEGRTYTPLLEASDGCQNTSSATASIHVPHDQSPRRADCLRPPSPGAR